MRTSIVVTLFVLVLCVPAMGQKASVEGVWAITERVTTGPNGATTQMTQPSMYVFTKKHYSIIYVASTSPRPEITDLNAATAEELRKVFVDDFIANAGTYEFKGGKLTTRPFVAKSPTAMKAGSFTTFSVKFSGNTMTLVSEANQNGPAANPTTTKLRRVE
jgi:hypothetical protein